MSRMLSALKKRMEQDESNKAPTGQDSSNDSLVGKYLAPMVSADVDFPEVSSNAFQESAVVAECVSDVNPGTLEAANIDQMYVFPLLSVTQNLPSLDLEALAAAAETFTQVLVEPSQSSSDYTFPTDEAEQKLSSQEPESHDAASEIFTQTEMSDMREHLC